MARSDHVKALLRSHHHRGDSLFIATSNHPALLDSAVWRRFDEIVELSSPDEAARCRILELKLRSVRHDFDVAGTAKRMEDFSAAEVETVALDAIRLMVRRLDKRVSSEHIANAIDRGEARRQIVQRSLGSHGSRTVR